MAQLSICLRVFSLFTIISLLGATYLITSGPRSSTDSIKTVISNQWENGRSLFSGFRSHYESAAGQRSIDIENLINRLLDAKLAHSASNELKRRALPDPLGIGNAISSLSGMTPQAASAAGQGMASTLSGIFSGLASSAESSVVSSLTGASGALGQGLAEGAVTGLNLPKKVGAVPPNNTGVAGVAQSLGSGISSTLTSQVDLSSLTTGIDITGAAQGLAAGLASGAASGAKLSMKALAPASGNSTAAVANNFGFGLTNTFLQSVDLNTFMSPEMTAQLMGSLQQSIIPSANGLGVGAAIGLKIAAPGTAMAAIAPPMPMNASLDIPQVVNDFTKTLSSSFLGSVDVGMLTAANPAQMVMIQQMALGALPGIGTGLGSGTVLGLGLGKAVAGPPPPPPTDINSGTQGFSQQLTESFFGTLDVGKITAVASDPAQAAAVQQMVLGALPGIGAGLGSGAANGLGLGKAIVAPSPPPTDLNSGAQSLSQQLTQSFFGTLDLGKINAVASDPTQSAAVQQMILGALPGIGAGLGSGTAAGLGLSKVAAGPSPPPTDLNSGAQGLSQQLTQNFFGSLDTSKIAAIAGSAPTMNIMLGPAAEGLGKGLGCGAAIGLGLKANMPMMPVMNPDTSAVTEMFSRNLVVSFLANGSLQTLSASAGALTSAAPSNLQVSKVAEGFGRGLLGGVESGLGMPSPNDTFDDTIMGGATGFGKGLGESGVGFIMMMISSNSSLFSNLGFGSSQPAPAPAVPASNPTPAIAPEAVAAPAMAPPATAPVTPSNAPEVAAAPAIASADAGSSSTANEAAVAAEAAAAAAGAAVTPVMAASINPNAMAPASMPAGDMSAPSASNPIEMIVRRQDQPSSSVSTMSTMNITAITESLIAQLNITKFDGNLQQGLDLLQCTGIGGFVAIGAGLQKSGFLKVNTNLGKIPGFGNTTFTVRQNKNTFSVAPGEALININGVPVIRLAILLASHIFAGIFAFFVFMPIVIILAGGQDITRMIHRPQIMVKSSRYQLLVQMIGVIPLSVISVATGIAAAGFSAFPNTPHKVLGFFLFLLGFAWVGLSRMSNASAAPNKLRLPNMIVVGLTILTSVAVQITGWNDLATISLCVTEVISVDAYIGLGLLIGALFSIAIGVMLVVFMMGSWMAQPETVVSEEKGFIQTTTKSSAAREIGPISGPFLPEQRFTD